LLAACPAQAEEEGRVREELEKLESGMHALQDTIENLVEAIERQGVKEGKRSDALLAKLAQYEEAFEQMKAAEQALLAKLSSVARTMIDRRIELLQQALE